MAAGKICAGTVFMVGQTNPAEMTPPAEIKLPLWAANSQIIYKKKQMLTSLSLEKTFKGPVSAVNHP